MLRGARCSATSGEPAKIGHVFGDGKRDIRENGQIRLGLDSAVEAKRLV
jgi:hypothetical protein